MDVVYSNSRNDVPRVAQQYGTIAPHTGRCASVLVVFVVFCVHVHSFAGLIRWMPPPTFRNTAIIDCRSDTTIVQLRAHWVDGCYSAAAFIGIYYLTKCTNIILVLETRGP